VAPVDASDPHLTPEIFAPSIAAHRSTLKAWLEEPVELPILRIERRGRMPP
jgi:hypothetical protein